MEAVMGMGDGERRYVWWAFLIWLFLPCWLVV